MEAQFDTSNPCSEQLDLNISSSSCDNSSKVRIRWTLELHDCFVKAVENIGGADSEYMCALTYPCSIVK